MKTILGVTLILLGASALAGNVEASLRSIPTPLTNHPGNVFLSGEEVVVRMPGAGNADFRLLDYEDNELSAIRVADGVAKLGRLPVGFYRLRAEGLSNWVSCAVIAPLKAPTPRSSPVALDVAMAWFYSGEKMGEAASLSALAGVNRVRDRLSWAEMEPKPGQWSEKNRYDASGRAQSEAGLQVLQVMHASPSWANPATKRFPLDLRDAYAFFREMARRWHGQVEAFEPWNEADISVFGGHTGSEMATLQKAAYLGLKAGDPGITACLNVFASHARGHLADLHENEAWPYFDTFNLHHYKPFEAYPQLYGDFRAISAGKPLWVTECALPVKWAGDEKVKEPTDSDLRVQSERVAKTFACSLHEGSAATFYFLLPHYVEGQTQFGVLRPDLTPRPAYVALAAVGRLLADAKPIGRLQGVSENVRAYLFHARPDGTGRRVLVAWAATGEAGLTLPAVPVAVFDHLGRPSPRSNRLELKSAPLFAVFPEDPPGRFQIQPPPAPAAKLRGSISPVVIQALWSEEHIVPGESAYRFSKGSIPLFIYNFSDQPVKGRLTATLPAGWKTRAFDRIEIAPQSRAELGLELDCSEGSARALETVRLAGDFGGAGKPVLSMRVVPDPNPRFRLVGEPITGTQEASRWTSTISGNGRCVLASEGAALSVEAEPRGEDRWVYPLFKLASDQRPPEGATGLGCTLGLEAGEGQFRVIFDEENGSSYVVDFLSQPKLNGTVEAIALFEQAVHGEGWSKPDPNGRLDPGQIVSFKLGCNTKASAVKLRFKNLRWVKP